MGRLRRWVGATDGIRSLGHRVRDPLNSVVHFLIDNTCRSTGTRLPSCKYAICDIPEYSMR